MVDVSRKTFERKDRNKNLNHKNFQEITIKYHSDHRKDKYEVVMEPKK